MAARAACDRTAGFCAKKNGKNKDLPRLVHRKDPPGEKKIGGVKETRIRRHSEQDIGSDFLRRWISACQGVIHHACGSILSAADRVFISGSAPQRVLVPP